MSKSRFVALFGAATIALAAAMLVAAGPPAYSHDDEYSAGEPGNPEEPARVVIIIMTDTDGKMTFFPAKIEVRKGEQIRLIIKNNGAVQHEFMLATVKENAEHEELMKKYPEMEHDDPNGISVKPKESAEIIWKFTKTGEFQFACLIPGHMEAGMHGVIVVK